MISITIPIIILLFALLLKLLLDIKNLGAFHGFKLKFKEGFNKKVTIIAKIINNNYVKELIRDTQSVRIYIKQRRMAFALCVAFLCVALVTIIMVNTVTKRTIDNWVINSETDRIINFLDNEMTVKEKKGEPIDTALVNYAIALSLVNNNNTVKNYLLTYISERSTYKNFVINHLAKANKNFDDYLSFANRLKHIYFDQSDNWIEIDVDLAKIINSYNSRIKHEISLVLLEPIKTNLLKDSINNYQHQLSKHEFYLSFLSKLGLTFSPEISRILVIFSNSKNYQYDSESLIKQISKGISNINEYKEELQEMNYTLLEGYIVGQLNYAQYEIALLNGKRAILKTKSVVFNSRGIFHLPVRKVGVREVETKQELGGFTQYWNEYEQVTNDEIREMKETSSDLADKIKSENANIIALNTQSAALKEKIKKSKELLKELIEKL